LSVADKKGDAVLLHVFASNERQEYENKPGLKKKGTKRQLVKFLMTLDLFP
jgi:hypothetical protein